MRSLPPSHRPQPYVHLHTTLLSTTNPAPNPAYFHLGPSAAPPSAILTTGAAFRAGDAVEPEIQSITYHGEVSPGAREWVVKIFSKEERSDAWLERVFGEGQVRWVRRKEWQSYPLCVLITILLPSCKASPDTLPLSEKLAADDCLPAHQAPGRPAVLSTERDGALDLHDGDTNALGPKCGRSARSGVVGRADGQLPRGRGRSSSRRGARGWLGLDLLSARSDVHSCTPPIVACRCCWGSHIDTVAKRTWRWSSRTLAVCQAPLGQRLDLLQSSRTK
jgi:hypothetical protein